MTGPALYRAATETVADGTAIPRDLTRALIRAVLALTAAVIHHANATGRPVNGSSEWTDAINTDLEQA